MRSSPSAAMSALQRPFADQRQPGAELRGQAPEGIDHHVRLLLAVEPPDINEQRLAVGQAQLAAKPLVAARRAELADLDAERHDVDRRRCRGCEAWRRRRSRSSAKTASNRR